jgi:hypothetical protein
MMKTKIFIACIAIAVTGCFLPGCDVDVKKDPVERSIYVNKTSLNMYVDAEVQLKASPAGETFVWSSENEEVVTVSQTGLVKAVGEGQASVVVESSGDGVKVDVNVRIFIPLTDISLSTASVRLFVGDEARIEAFPVPNTASDVTFAWRSENPGIATVDEKGLVTAVARGTTTVVVGSGSFEKAITVSVIELYKCDKTGWSVEVSDQTESDGGGKDKMIDNNYDNGGYWHSQWSGGNAPLPHWAIIDMKEPVEVARIATLRRNNGDTRTLQYFVGNSPDAGSDTWVKVAEGTYASTSANHTMTLDLAEPVTGRYLKLVLPDSYRDVFTAICEVDVYGILY